MITKTEIENCQDLSELALMHNEIEEQLEEGVISLEKHIELISYVMDTYHQLEFESMHWED